MVALQRFLYLPIFLQLVFFRKLYSLILSFILVNAQPRISKVNLQKLVNGVALHLSLCWAAIMRALFFLWQWGLPDNNQPVVFPL